MPAHKTVSVKRLHPDFASRGAIRAHIPLTSPYLPQAQGTADVVASFCNRETKLVKTGLELHTLQEIS